MKAFKLHLISFRYLSSPEKISVIGNGVVINPKSLVKELLIHEEGRDRQLAHFRPRPCHPPTYIELDRSKKSPKGDNKIGTTIKAGLDLTWTRGCVGNPGLRTFWDRVTSSQNAFASTLEEKKLPSIYQTLMMQSFFSFDDIFEEYYEYGHQIANITDTVIFNDALITASACS